MTIPTFAAVLLAAAVAPHQPVGESLRQMGSKTSSAINAFVSSEDIPSPATPAVSPVPTSTPVANTATPAAAPVATPAVVQAVQTYSYQKINGRLYLVANPVTYSTAVASQHVVSTSNYSPAYSTGTVYYNTGSSCPNGNCPLSTPTYTFSSCPNGRCPNVR